MDSHHHYNINDQSDSDAEMFKFGKSLAQWHIQVDNASLPSSRYVSTNGQVHFE